MLSALTYISCTKEDAKQIAYNTVPLATAEVSANIKADVAVDFISVIANEQFDATANTTTSRNAEIAATSGGTVTVITNSNTSRTITVDFGTTNQLFRGNNLRGKIILNRIVDPNSTIVNMTINFNNFYINDNLIEGSLDWKREMIDAGTTNARPKITLTINNLKLTTILAGVFTRTGTRTTEMTAGYSTSDNKLDDKFSTYGSFTTTHPSGLVYTTTINQNESLIFKTECNTYPYPVSGKLNLTRGLNNAVIDFGTGTGSVACDNLATLSINGGVATEIKLGN